MTPLADGERRLYELGILIAGARRLVWTAAARELESAGISILAWGLIARLVRFGPAAQKELADAIGQHPAGISRLVEELVEQGYVHRARDPEDRRRMLVKVTASGRAMFRAGRPHVAEAMTKSLGVLPPAEQRRLHATLGKLCPLVMVVGDESEGAEEAAPRSRRRPSGPAPARARKARA